MRCAQLGHEVIIVAPPSAETESFGSDAGLVAWLKRHLPKFVYELMELAYRLVPTGGWRKRSASTGRTACTNATTCSCRPASGWRAFKLPMLLEVNAPIFEERGRYDGLALKGLARWSQAYCLERNADRCCR